MLNSRQTHEVRRLEGEGGSRKRERARVVKRKDWYEREQRETNSNSRQCSRTASDGWMNIIPLHSDLAIEATTTGITTEGTRGDVNRLVERLDLGGGNVREIQGEVHV